MKSVFVSCSLSENVSHFVGVLYIKFVRTIYIELKGRTDESFIFSLACQCAQYICYIIFFFWFLGMHRYFV